MKTPFGHRLLNELDNEFRRMDSEWFFQWYGLGSGRLVNVDRFDGQRIQTGGVSFEDGMSVERIYWDAVARYVRNKINEIFERTETEIRAAAPHNQNDLVEDAAVALSSHCGRILNHALETDRRLKGRGYPDKNYRAPNSARVSFFGEIEQRKNALIEFYKPKPPKSSWSLGFEKIVERNKGKLQTIGLAIALASIILAIGKAFGFL